MVAHFVCSFFEKKKKKRKTKNLLFFSLFIPAYFFLRGLPKWQMQGAYISASLAFLLIIVFV
jgi:hypothetical protein